MVNPSDLQNSIYNIAYFHREDVCRLCFASGATANLWHGTRDTPENMEAPSKPIENTPDDNSDLLKDIIAKITHSLGIDVKDEPNFPKKICQECIISVNQFDKYKTSCEQADKRLKEIFSSAQKVKIEPDLPIKHEKTDIPDYDSSCSVDNIETNPEPAQKKKKSKSNLEHDKKVAASKNVAKMRSSKTRGPTYCNICHCEYGAEFSEHNRTAHGVEEGGFKCFGCEKRFGTRKSRLAHEIRFCKELKDGYSCVACSAHLPNRRVYEAHAREHRAGRTPADVSGKHFQCAPCGKTFKTRANHLQHVALHQDKKNFVCETSGGNPSKGDIPEYSTDILDEEDDSVGDSDSSWEPSFADNSEGGYAVSDFEETSDAICGRVFNRQDYLHKHILTHTGQKQYVCPHCGFRATQKSSLTVHIRKHTGERPFSCDICQQRCVSSSNLLAHRRRHDGLKNFECSLCGKKFGYKLSLEEHMASTHERLKTHACKLCGATYTRQRGLRRHARVKHGALFDENAQDFLNDELLKDCAFVKNSNMEQPEVDVFVKNANMERPAGDVFVKNSNIERTPDAFVKMTGDDYLKEGQSDFLKMEPRQTDGFLKNLTERQDDYLKDASLGHRGGVLERTDYLKSVGQSDNAFVV